MLLKLATRNIRRSVRDYAIYFVTLLLSVTIFYSFNSISSQQVMTDISNASNSNIVDFTGYLMSLFSIAVAFVLGFLVIYANQLLVRRRKREFGIYFTLGMKPGQVSRIILYETVLIGLISLVLGLALGVLVAQFLSFVTAAMFGIAMPDYRFEFSSEAFMATLVCFIAIFVVVAIFNVVSIRRCKLIDLINADAKNQKIAVRNPWICLVLFVLSLIVLACAYEQLFENGMTLMFDDNFTAATILMLVGSLMFFFSLAGFIVAIITHTRSVYNKKLRPFTTRQVASKINTSFASIWVVCILLFFAITTFATGMALVQAFVGDIEAANPYDISVTSYNSTSNAPQNDNDVMEGEPADVTESEILLKENISDWNDVVKASVQLDMYDDPAMTYGDYMSITGTSTGNDKSDESVRDTSVSLASITQFNALLDMMGEMPIVLESDRYLVTNNANVTAAMAKAIVDQKTPLKTPASTLHPLDEIKDVQLTNHQMLTNTALMVVPDAVVNDLIESGEEPYCAFINIMLDNPGVMDEPFIDQIFDVMNMSNMTGSVISSEEMISQTQGLRVTITYLALYIGLVFLIATAAILAIQLLSMTIDSQRRYSMLSRIGCSASMLNRSLFAQVLIYFAAPLILAACHSAWTIYVMSGTLFNMLGQDITPSIFASAGFVLVIYGLYMLITYFASRGVVKQALC